MENIKTLTVDELIELLNEFSLSGLGQNKVWTSVTLSDGSLVQSGIVGFEEHNDSLEVVSEEDYRADLFKDQYELLTGCDRLDEFSYNDRAALG